MVQHFKIRLPAYPYGYHLITKLVINLIIKELGELPENGLINLFLQHTSAGLSINENADNDVRKDLQQFMDKLAPEHDPDYSHIFEGDDDMPAHIKTFLTGNSIQIPIIDNNLGLGIWQGIYLCEFRKTSHSREIIATIIT
jgi:secondary thiamine-phosphate synthase enzyme